jgi:hypothetical protein
VPSEKTAPPDDALTSNHHGDDMIVEIKEWQIGPKYNALRQLPCQLINNR